MNPFNLPPFMYSRSIRLGGALGSEVVLVSSFDAAKLSRSGDFSRLSTYEAMRLFSDWLWSNPSEVRSFVASCGLGDTPLYRVTDVELRDMVEHEIRSGNLVAFRRNETSKRSVVFHSEASRLIKAIEAIHPKDFLLQGRGYRIEISEITNRMGRRDTYEPLNERMSQRLLQTMAGDNRRPSSLRKLLVQAAELTKRKTPRQPRDELVLLRRLVSRLDMPEQPVAAMTPSELRKQKEKEEQKSAKNGRTHSTATPIGTAVVKDQEEEKSWVEIIVKDSEEKPRGGESYKLALPNGKVKEGRLDQKGGIYESDLDDGECEIEFPNLDESIFETIEA